MALRASQYFKDYDLEESVDERGKVQRRYVYHGDWFERRLTDSQRRTERYAGVLTGILAGCLFILASIQDTPANKSGFFSVITVLNIIPAFCVLAGACIAFFKKGNLTRGDYNERMLLLRAMSFTAAVFLLILSVGYALNGFAGAASGWTAFGAALAASVLYAIIGIHEYKVKYTVHPGSKPSAERKGWRQKMKEGNHE